MQAAFSDGRRDDCDPTRPFLRIDSPARDDSYSPSPRAGVRRAVVEPSVFELESDGPDAPSQRFGDCGTTSHLLRAEEIMAKAKSHIPEGMRSVTAHLVVKNALDSIEFYKRA